LQWSGDVTNNGASSEKPAACKISGRNVVIVDSDTETKKVCFDLLHRVRVCEVADNVLDAPRQVEVYDNVVWKSAMGQHNTKKEKKEGISWTKSSVQAGSGFLIEAWEYISAGREFGVVNDGERGDEWMSSEVRKNSVVNDGERSDGKCGRTSNQVANRGREGKWQCSAVRVLVL
jgi:hypothetical protein